MSDRAGTHLGRLAHGLERVTEASDLCRGDEVVEADYFPVRTCIGCCERVAKSDLVRLVVIDGSLVIDKKSTLPGRGAYLHPRSDCVDSALRRRALTRALRWEGTLDADLVSNQLANSEVPRSR